MHAESPKSDADSGQVRSGPEIVADFVSSLKKDPTLDPETVAAVESLLSKRRLTFTNLLKALEEARGRSDV
jgi:hypothetical protein